MKNPTVMVVQMELIANNPEENMKKITRYFDLAGKHNCDFIVFPEKCNGVLSPEFHNEKKHDVFLKKMQELSSQHNIYCVAGSLLEKDDGYYNSAFLISREGKIMGKHRKIALLHYCEKNHTKPGTQLATFATEFGNIGVLICRDMLYPELAQSLSKQGAKIIFCPTFWSYYSTLYEENPAKLKNEFPVTADFTTLKNVPLTRAIENEVFFVMANAAGTYKEPGYVEKLAGHSSICAPLQGTVCSLTHSDESYIVHELNFSLLEDSGDTYAIARNAPE